MDTTELCYTPATVLAGAIRRRELSPVELVDALLARIEAVNPRLNANCPVAADHGRESHYLRLEDLRAPRPGRGRRGRLADESGRGDRRGQDQHARVWLQGYPR